MKKNQIYEYKKVKIGNAMHYLFREQGKDNWKHHNPEGPAIEPLKSNKKEYYLFGIQKTLEEFKDIKSSKEGLPWYKNPSMKATTRF